MRREHKGFTTEIKRQLVKRDEHGKSRAFDMKKAQRQSQCAKSQ
ncbi:hypothetical protein [Solibacillus palustris]|nr:hypothetical protein [Solibacillus sp. MA9]